MNLTRWKLLAGVFGISVCGIAALAEPACRTVGHPAARSDPDATEGKPKGATEPKAKPVEAPVPILIDLPVPATIPPIIEPRSLTIKEEMAIAVEQGNSEPMPPVGVATPAEVPLLLPEVKSAPLLIPSLGPVTLGNPAVPAFTGPLVTQDQFSKQLTNPVPVESRQIPLPPVPTLPPTPKSLPDIGVPQQPVEYFPVPTTVTTVTTVASIAPSDKKLKVTLQMDDGNPKFEVRDGEEVVLKVISDKVDVTSPKNKGERWSTLKAMGQVKFMTPGGDGFCDELHVVPGTGEVIAVGHVKFTYNWGKVETSATAEKMNFRLGTQPPAGK